MEDAEMFSESDFENGEQQNHVQWTSDNSIVEIMDTEPSGDITNSNQSNVEGDTQRQLLSDESGIDLESSFERSVLTTRNTSNIDSTNYNNTDESIDPGDDQSCTVPIRKKTRPRSVKLKISLSIFKIDIEKVDEAIKNSKIATSKNNEARIDFIVEAANRKYKRKRERQSGQEQDLFVTHRYDGYTNTKFEFVYYQKISYSTDDETQQNTQKIQKIRFLHRCDSVEEIFALPSGSGRHAVLQWADTNFPSSIASATLDPKSVTQKEVKNLYENRYLTKFKMKTGESLQTTPEFHLRFAPKIYTTYHANINDVNAELKSVLGHESESKLKMQVSLESVQFPGVVIDINQYADLCEKLSEIYNNPDLPRSRDFDGYLSKVSQGRNNELDDLLLKELDQFFRLTSMPQSDNVLGKLKNFMITQKHSTKYFEAAEYIIYKNGKLLKKFKERPQLHELHTIFVKNCPSYSSASFRKRFMELKISSTSLPGDENTIREKLFNCLEGVFYDELTEKNYWRVSSSWYQVTGKYSFDIYAEYIRVLKKSLLGKTESSLTHLWPLKGNREKPANDQTNKKGFELTLQRYRQGRFVKEGEYNLLYQEVPYFTVTDCIVAPFGIEICDLFQFVPNSDGKFTINLYHLKKAFGADGYRVAICQILSCVYYLHDSFTRKGSTDSAAYKLFLCVEKHQKDKMPHKNYDEFLEQLRSATIIFCPLFESGNRELDTEYMSRIKYDFSDIEDSIDPEFREDLKTELESFLLNSKYIYPDKDFTQKWYDACAVTRDQGFFVRNDRGFAVDPFPKRPNLNSKQLRRILKEKYYKTVNGLGTKQLIVHMSEVLNYLGFGFQICQIEGAGDEFLPN